MLIIFPQVSDGLTSASASKSNATPGGAFIVSALYVALAPAFL